jgi:CRP/FNR family cyclic AMP-dependent transcriptional regulator
MRVEGKQDGDRDLLAGLGTRSCFQAGESLGAIDEPPGGALLITEGSAQLSVETPFSPFGLGILEAPTLLYLHRSQQGGTCPALLESVGESEAVALSPKQVASLLSSPNREAQAFRRLTLAGVTRVIRLANRAISKMFDVRSSELTATFQERREDITKSQQSVPVSSLQVDESLQVAGLSFRDLPSVGLTARRIDAESFLVQAGTRADEAFLLAEGRLRISLPIPRVGEEALTVLDPGQIVGVMSLVDNEPRSADVIAHEGPALVYVLSRTVFRYLLNSGPAAGAPLLAGLAIDLSQRTEEALRRVVNFRALSGPF